MKIIIVSIDSLRADSLGCYGYKRHTSPQIDDIARSGILFKNAYTQANWTNPSYYSLITSFYPSVHGVAHHCHGIAGKGDTLPEVLVGRGYKTFLYSNYYTLLDEKRFGRHFQNRIYFDIDREEGGLKERISRAEKEDLFFLIHIGNYVHEPYCAPPELVREFWPGKVPEKDIIRQLTEEMNLSDESMRNVLRKVNLHRIILSRTETEYLKACYDAGIKYIDRWVGEFFRFLKNHAGEEIIFIFTADHGQGFFEHGFFGHGLSLHQELIRVPLVVYMNNCPSFEIEEGVRLIDIFPTLMDIIGFNLPFKSDGTSFRNSLEEGDGRKVRPVISEGFPFVTCIEEDKKLIISFYRLMSWKEKTRAFKALLRTRNLRRLLFHLYSLCKTSFYDLERDPDEKRNLVWIAPRGKKRLKKLLKSWYRDCLSRRLEVTDERIGEERIISQLKGLGYL